MPEVAGWTLIPQPRTTTHRIPMFHGPSGMLAPMPVRIRYEAVPRATDRPSMRTANGTPAMTHATEASAVIWTTCRKVSARKAASTSS